ncbi:hypothetical protein CPLU01_02103 [Colletotrichum plurivorum]|uniref:MICOS complex subunit MIC12 n=1 Tax=Colletotrichum plurivorum TaxID=2175906 RepID=A0A8H6NMP5_9PEZI|nr:hypothetical protein CPLU01_02103 [Colletotrichum plurivorum]
MGFTTGFTGGVTLTLGVAYLTVLAHQRNREAQSHNLRSQRHVLSTLLEPQIRIPPPLTRSEQAVRDRENLVESAKDRWNHEVENAVRWAQSADWAGVREALEGSAARLWGGTVDKTVEAAPRAKEVVERQGESIQTEARSAWDRAREKTLAAEEAARARAAEARRLVEARAAEARQVVETRAAEVKAVVGEVVEKGRQQGEAALVKAQQAAGVIEDKVSVKEDGEVLPAASPVQRALHQRYEKPSGLTKTVKEVLAERYQRMDERDNTQLRGL